MVLLKSTRFQVMDYFVNGAAELLDATNIKEILVTDSVVTEK